VKLVKLFSHWSLSQQFPNFAAFSFLIEHIMRSLFIAFVLVATSFAVNAQTTPTTVPATTAPATTTAAATPTIVFVNADTLLSNYDYYKAEKAKMETLSKNAQAEINAKGDAFQKEVAAYQKGANALTPVQKAATEKRLAKKQQDLQALSQNTGKQLQDIEASENATLYERINTFLKMYTKTKGYKIVLTYSKSSPSMLYGDDSLDVTKEVLAGLNAEYKAGIK
jgi:outer membrane protein